MPQTIRERELRRLSEAEQRKLLAAVDYRAKHIKTLRQTIGYRLDTIGEFTHHSIASIHALRSMTSELHTIYLQQLEGCYARVDAVMNASGITSLPETTLNSVYRRKTDGNVEYFQHLTKGMLPYSFQQICRLLLKARHENDGSDEIMDLDEDILTKSRLLQSLNPGMLAQRYVSRYYQEENRVVLVWKISSKGNGCFSGLYADETGWMCIQPSPTGILMEICVQQAPMRFGMNHSCEPATSKFYDLLRDSLEADKLEMTRCMERLLIDDIVAGISAE